MDILTELAEITGAPLVVLDRNDEICTRHEAPLTRTELVTADGRVVARTICPMANTGCLNTEKFIFDA